MIKRTGIFLGGLLSLFLISVCNSNVGNSEESLQKVSKVDILKLPGTYEFTGNGDTIRIDLVTKQDSVKGHLLYSLGEKDKNVGEFKGVIEGARLVGEYYFVSENIGSVRDMIFNITEGGLVEGYGDMEEREGAFKFVDTSALKFNHGMLLRKQ